MKKTLTNLFFLLALSSTCYAQNDAASYYRLGLEYIQKKEYLNGIRELTEAISKKNDYADAYYQRAIAKKYLGDEMGFVNTELISDLVKAIEYGNPNATKMLLEFTHVECYTFDAAFMEPDKVYCADFSGKKLKNLPTEMDKLTALVNLTLIDNELSSIEPSLAKLQSILILDASSNKIAELNDNIGEMNNLIELIINDNGLHNLPESIGKLKKMRILYVRNNFLHDLPASFSELVDLEDLDLSHNELTHIPPVLFKMKKLKNLDLFGNDLPQEEKDNLMKALPNTNIHF